MINYSKVRESVEKNSSKKSLSKALPANKSHTNSVNIKLTKDSGMDQIKIPLKTMFKDKTEATLTKIYHPQTQSHHKKYSVKLQSDQKENMVKKKQNPPYDVTIFRPFQETNRYLETERVPKDYKISNERTPIKQALRLRTDYHNQKQLRTDYTDATPEKMKKETSTKHTTQNEGRTVKVSAQNLRGLMNELMRQQQEVSELQRELQFYRVQAAKSNCNPVLRALKA